jgi:hypothetical protein
LKQQKEEERHQELISEIRKLHGSDNNTSR